MTFAEKCIEFQDKWITRYEQSGIKDFYKFYRMNYVELFKDYEELNLFYREEHPREITYKISE